MCHYITIQQKKSTGFSTATTAKLPQSDRGRAARLLVGIARGTQYKSQAEPGHAQHAAHARMRSVLAARPQSDDDGAVGWSHSVCLLVCLARMAQALRCVSESQVSVLLLISRRTRVAPVTCVCVTELQQCKLVHVPKRRMMSKGAAVCTRCSGLGIARGS